MKRITTFKVLPNSVLFTVTIYFHVNRKYLNINKAQFNITVIHEKRE